MAPAFGTSGLRGLVVALTPAVVADYTRAFLTACPTPGLLIGRDLRASSAPIARVVMQAARGEGVAVTDLGALPTPALALAATARQQAAIMVTGSHIPADRNGLKFYTSTGEITKADEANIDAALGRPGRGLAAAMRSDAAALAAYEQRYVHAFGSRALAGLRVGLWQHSSVARDVLARILRRLGAHVHLIGRREDFIAVDTEAISDDMRARFAAWLREEALDAVVSADGDGDRPLVADAGGIIPGDVLGMIAAGALAADTVVTPVTSNTGVERMGRFRVIRTRIGSPHVIAGMQDAVAHRPHARVAGYEANGGFLLGFAATGPAGPIAPLWTRDAALPILAGLWQAREKSMRLADLRAALPPRFTASGRIADTPSERARAFLAALARDPDGMCRAAAIGGVQHCDLADGVRLTLADGRIIHCRRSGNAPDFRLYAEAESAVAADALLARLGDFARMRLADGASPAGEAP